MTCCHTYRPQLIEHVRETIATDRSLQRPKTTNQLRKTIYLDPFVLATTSTLTPTTLANPSSTQGFLVFILKGSSCSSAIPSLTRGMPFPTQLEECHVLNTYLELNSRDTFQAQLKEHQQPTFEVSLKPCRSRTSWQA